MVNGFIRSAVAVAFPCALALSAPIAAPVAAATPAADSGSVRVSFADLDLRTADGVQRLHSRIHHAARAICGQPGIRDLKAMRETDNCRRVALAGAVPQVELAVAQAREGKVYAANAVQLAFQR